jgi:peptide methionine sulfoxide reductase msrA/msrB
MNTTQTAVFAGGCFWCVEHDFQQAPGVTKVISGYTGGDQASATYMQVAAHVTKHREAVQVIYDPTKTTFKNLVHYFLDHIDPTDQGGQFHDRGESYQSAIYFKDDTEKEMAQAALKELDESKIYDKPAVVDVLMEMPFYPAEESHQNYAEKNPERYAAYRQGSGREDFVNRTCAIREDKHVSWKE